MSLDSIFKKYSFLVAGVLTLVLFGFSADVVAQEVSAQDIPAVVEAVDTGSVPVPDDGDLAFDSGGGDGGVFFEPSSDAADSQDFFDAEDLVPQGQMTNAAPRKVDPSLEPGSSLLIVRQSHGPDSYAARLVSAERAMKLGRYDSALLILDSLYDKNRRDSRVLMYRAVAFQHLGRFEEAMKAYEATSEIEPDNINVKINMLGLLGTKYPSVALRKLLDLRSEHESNVGIVAQIAVLQAQLGDFKAGLEYLGMAASMEPSSATHVFNMAVIADRAGDVSQAITYYEKALELDTLYGASKTIPRDSVYERLAQIR